MVYCQQIIKNTADLRRFSVVCGFYESDTARIISYLGNFCKNLWTCRGIKSQVK